MKTFDQLTADQRDKALEKCRGRLLSAILEGSVRFNDTLNEDDLQARIDAAIAKADKMRTPWFAHEYILDTCREDIDGLVQCDAEDALYPEPTEHVITGIAS